ncbi:MAG TPA: amidase [Chryseosolibacter sp.]
MKRREFIHRSALAAIVLPSIIGNSCKSSPGAPGGNHSFELDEMDIASLQDAMANGKYTSRQLCELYLKRITEIDKSGPMLNSVIELNPDALAIADGLDKERRDGKVRGPMHGIPVLIKDNIDTGDKMMTTAGSLALEGNYASNDAFIIAKLRECGAVLLGKTNLSEWANFRSTRSSSGWSSRGGQTRNPYILDRNPCGSSSGTGTAVAANLCAIGIGTETDGSIGCPSSINGLVGIKPTVGLWSRSGIIPISVTQDTAGPMARTVKDAAILLGPLCGVDAADPFTAKSEGKFQKDYTQFLKPDGLNGKRIGVEKSFLKVHEGVDAILAEAIDTLRKQGAEVIEVDFREKTKSISADEYNVLKFQFKDGVNKYLSASNAKVKSLAEVIKFNKENESRAMPFFKQEILTDSEAKESLESNEYTEAVTRMQNTARKAIDDTMLEFKLDSIIGPTNGPSWCTDLVNGDSFTGYGMYSSAAVAGYPHICVPMGFVHELPIGLTFIGREYEEANLITLAYAYEQASKKRKAPQFVPSLSYTTDSVLGEKNNKQSD